MPVANLARALEVSAHCPERQADLEEEARRALGKVRAAAEGVTRTLSSKITLWANPEPTALRQLRSIADGRQQALAASEAKVARLIGRTEAHFDNPCDDPVYTEHLRARAWLRHDPGLVMTRDPDNPALPRGVPEGWPEGVDGLYQFL